MIKASLSNHTWSESISETASRWPPSAPSSSKHSRLLTRDMCSVRLGGHDHSISFLTRHLDYTVNIYVQTSSKKRWRIGGFLESLASFVSGQGLWSSFGQDNHGYPCREPCQSCDVIQSPARGRTYEIRCVSLEHGKVARHEDFNAYQSQLAA